MSSARSTPAYAYYHDSVPPTISTLHQLQEDPGTTIYRMAFFILAMFGNSIARGFPVSSNLIFSQICGAIVLLLAIVGVVTACRRRLFFNRGLPWACMLLFTFLTAAFVCIGRVWRGDFQPLTPRYTTFGSLCIVGLILFLHSSFSGLSREGYRPRSAIAWSSVLLWIQGLLVGLYLCVQGVNWTYGHALMEEWRLTRWHARARLHFLGKIPIYAGPNLLGGKEDLIEARVPILERLGMLTPPRAHDLRISALGREITSDGSKRGRFEALTARGLNGWRASGSALSLGGRSADAVVLGVQNAAGEWVAVAAATPISPPRYLRRSTAMDLEFLAVSGPQKRAMDFRRRVLYLLPSDQHFTRPGQTTSAPEAAALQERKPGPL